MFSISFVHSGIFKWLFCCLLSIFLSAIFLLLLRLRAKKNIYFLLIGLLPVVIPLLLNKDARIYAWHNWMQAGIVYQILNGYIPPDNPLFAGHASLYPWGYPYLLALVSRIANVTPFISSAFVSVALLAFLLFITFHISKMISEDRIANIFSVLVPIYAFTFTQTPIFLQYALKIKNSLPFNIGFLNESRVNILQKFSGDTAYPAGIAFFALFLFSLIRAIGLSRLDIKVILGLAAGAICLGLFYPFMYLAIYPIVFLIIANDLLKKRFNKNDWVVILILISSSLVLLPYFISFTASKGSQASIAMLSSLINIVKRAAVIFLTVAPIGLILIFSHRSLKETFVKKKRVCEVLFFSIIACLIMFLGLKAPMCTQYKFLALACYCVGIFGGVAFANLYRKEPYVCLLILSLFLLPTSYDIYEKIHGFHPKIKAEFIEIGAGLVSRSSDNEFYKWVLKNTNKEDVFVDSNLHIPILGQRRLYIGWNKNQRECGYSMSPKCILQLVNGYDVKELQCRWDFVQMLFDENLSIKKETVRIVAESMPNCKIYFVARDAPRRDRFVNSGIFDEVFYSGGISVFIFNGLEKTGTKTNPGTA